MSIQSIIEERTGYNAGSDSYVGFDPTTEEGHRRRAEVGEPLLTLVIRDETDTVVTVPLNVHVRFYNSAIERLILKGNNSIEIAGCRISDEIVSEEKALIFAKNDSSSLALETGASLVTPDGQCQINKLNLSRTRMVVRGSPSLKVQIGYAGSDMILEKESSLEWFDVEYLGATDAWQIDDSIGRFRSCEFENGGRGKRTKLFFTDCKVWGEKIGVHLSDHSFVQATRSFFRGPRSGGLSPLDWEGLHIEKHSQGVLTTCNKSLGPDFRFDKLSAREKSHISGRNILIEQPPEPGIATWCLLARDSSTIDLTGTRADRIYTLGTDDKDGIKSCVRLDRESKLSIHGYKEIFSDQPGLLPAVTMTDGSEFVAEDMEAVWSYFGTGIKNTGGGVITVEDLEKGVTGGGAGITYDGGPKVTLRNFGTQILGGKDEGIKGEGGGTLTIMNVPEIFSGLSQAMKLSGGVRVIGRDISKGIHCGGGHAISTTGGSLDLENVEKVETEMAMRNGILASGCTLRLKNVTKIVSTFGDGMGLSSCKLLLVGCKVEGGGHGLTMTNTAATTRNNVKFFGGDLPALIASGGSLDSNGDQEFESGQDDAIRLEGTPSRIIGAGKIDGFLNGIGSSPNVNLFLDGGELRPTEIIGRMAAGIRVDGRRARIYNCAKIEGGVQGIIFDNVKDSEIGKCTLIQSYDLSTLLLSFPENVRVFSCDVIICTGSLHAIEVTGGKKLSIEACGLIEGFMDGINAAQTDIVIRRVSDKIFGENSAGFGLDGCQVECFKAEKIEGGMKGINASSSHIRIVESEMLVGYGEQGALLTNGTDCELHRIGIIQGGIEGISVDQGTCRVYDAGLVEGGVDGIKSSGSSIEGSNIGLVSGGVNGLTATVGTVSMGNVGQLVGGVTGVSLTGISSGQFKQVDMMAGGTNGLRATGTASIQLHRVTAIVGPVAVLLTGSTVEEYHQGTIEGAIALQLTEARMVSDYVTYTGIVNLIRGDWEASHGVCVGVLESLSSRIFNREWIYLGAFIGELTESRHSDTTFTGAVEILSSSYSSADSRILGVLTAQVSDLDLKSTTIAGATILLSCSMEGDKATFAGAVVAEVSSVHVDRSLIAGSLIVDNGSVSYRSTTTATIIAQGSSVSGQGSVAGMVLLSASSGDFVQCTSGMVLITGGGATCVGGVAGLLVVGGASAISVSCSGVILGGPFPMTGKPGRTVNVATQEYEVGSLLSNKTFTLRKIEGLALTGNIQLFAATRSVWLQALIGNVHSKAGLFATHDKLQTAPPPVPV